MDLGPKLGVTLGGLNLKNPVMTASGTFGYGREFESLIDLDRLGAIIVKGLSLTPSRGNPPPRIAETSCGMLNAIGLENIGVDAFIADILAGNPEHPFGVAPYKPVTVKKQQACGL